MSLLSVILPNRLWDVLAARYEYRLPVYPVTEVYIHHGASFAPLRLRDADGDGVPDKEEEIARAYDRHHQVTKGWSNIAYNFLVGLSGSILEGRGWRNQGGATGNGKDRHSLSICAIGNFETQEPTREMVDAIILWIITGIELGHISPNVKIYGHRDGYSTTCPGKNLYKYLPEIRSRVADRRVLEDSMDINLADLHSVINASPDGTKSEVIRLWQVLLAQFGLLEFADVDGVKGPKTRAAHKMFEDSVQGHKSPNETIGSKTWALLLAGPKQQVVEVPVKPDLSRLNALAEAQGRLAQAIQDEVDKVVG